MTEPPAMTEQVYLVVTDSSGLYGTYLDGAFAHRIAAAVEGVIVAVPVIADYRTKPRRHQLAPSEGAMTEFAGGDDGNAKDPAGWYPLHDHGRGYGAHMHHRDNGGHGSHAGLTLLPFEAARQTVIEGRPE